jgi:hypothetical protein
MRAKKGISLSSSDLMIGRVAEPLCAQRARFGRGCDLNLS